MFNPIDPNGFLQPKKGMTSVEAAELWLKEQDRAQQEHNATFSLDGLIKSGITRSIGFPFSVTIEHNRFICRDDTNGYKTTAFYDIMDDKAVKRLVRALMRLKKAHDIANDLH